MMMTTTTAAARMAAMVVGGGQREAAVAVLPCPTRTCSGCYCWALAGAEAPLLPPLLLLLLLLSRRRAGQGQEGQAAVPEGCDRQAGGALAHVTWCPWRRAPAAGACCWRLLLAPAAGACCWAQHLEPDQPGAAACSRRRAPSRRRACLCRAPQALQYGAGSSSEDEGEGEGEGGAKGRRRGSPRGRTYVEEQEELKRAFHSALPGGSDDEEGGWLVCSGSSPDGCQARRPRREACTGCLAARPPRSRGADPGRLHTAALLLPLLRRRRRRRRAGDQEQERA
jgi:hypothetical protein